jgi:hypothetical protein
MNSSDGSVRARSRGRVWLAAFLGLFLSASSLAAQVPDSVPARPPDPAQPDTVQVPIPPEEVGGDTIPAALQEAAESTAPVPAMPDFPSPQPIGWSSARWSWGRDELSRLPGMTLLEFIEGLPGFVAFRAGQFGRPVGLTALGMGGGRVRVRIDGFELDPHDAAAFPLETISVVDLSKVTVERSLSEILVTVETFRLESPDPYSFVELGTGVFQTRLLRALFSRGFGSRSVATGAFGLAQTGGIGLSEDYASKDVILRWTVTPSTATGVEVEYRRTAIDRESTAFPLETTRTDLVLRGRATVGDRITLEAHFGGSNARDDILPEPPDDPTDEPDGEPTEPAVPPPLLESLQAGARAAYSTERLAITGGARLRTDRGAPVAGAPFEAEASAVVRPFRSLRLEAGTTIQASDEGDGRAARVAATIVPLPVLSLFGSAEFGTRLHTLRYQPEPVESLPQPTIVRQEAAEATGFRAGAELAGRLGSAGVAIFQSGTTPVSAFGLPFDNDVGPSVAGSLQGAEAYYDIPILPRVRALRLEGWYTRWFGDVSRRYTPADLGRFGLTFHDVYIGGQLEPFARLELVRQGPSLVPLGASPDADPIMPVIQTLNFNLRLRIIDVQAFVIWDNLLLAETSLPLPGAPPPRPRVVYGASWRFRN